MRFGRGLIGVVALILCGMIPLHAQQRGATGNRTQGVQRNQGGGTGGSSFGGGGSSGASGSRQYSAPGTIGEAIVTSDPESRRLIVITDDETSRYISQVITNLDRPKPQVVIKVVFLEVTYNDGSDIGIEGSVSKKIDTSISGLFTNAFGLGQQGVMPIPPGAGLYQFLGNDFNATIRAIAHAGKTEVLSRPSVLARNNQQAIITVGQELPFITNTRFDTTGNQINTIQYQDIGIILRVTPFITSDGLVEMIISPEISNLTDQTVPISGGSNPVSAPVIAKRSADTVVVTPDAQTVIIGGLMENKKIKSESKIPFLGDIPYIGLAFKRTIKSTIKTELMIFLTPYIVMNPTQLAAMTVTERSKSISTTNSFSQEELNRFLDQLPNKAVPKTDKKPSANESK